MAGYEVDLSYLQDTLKKLQGVADGMDTPCGVANYQTNLSSSQFGGEGFLEAQNLYQAHDNMKSQLSTMITALQQMIQEFTDKTGRAHDQYAGTDSSVSGTFSRGAS
ncbi:hypothetical protein ABH931_007639 [Streptacidiphilus sp. MAP12-33]|uniref:hypothetical protein n=1 Tax=Streptacidiphilus sp. MAP12-33 TaxID=3156266 RepID=UPI0035132717